MINHNRVCNLQDFADASLRDTIREVFAHERGLFPSTYPDGVADSKQWEIAMAVRALREFGAVRPDARLLGIGAGTEATIFHLSRHVRQVIASDMYAGAGPWSDVAPSGFLVTPSDFAGQIACEPQRIVPLHQDARALDLPEDEFDGVFSSGSIEHFGSLQSVANAAYEIGRVLKPGGIATIATEFKVAGPPDGDGWDPTVILFSPDKLNHWIIEASGLEPVDAMETELTDETLSVQRDLLGFLNAAKQITHPAQKIGVYPNLILYHEGYLFCSVHLTLRKPISGWGKDNQWAAPDRATRQDVMAGKRAAIAALSGVAGKSIAEFFSGDGQWAGREPEPTNLGSSQIATLEAELAAAHRSMAALTAEISTREAQLAAVYGSTAALTAEISALRASSSWRLTAPFRAMLNKMRR